MIYQGGTSVNKVNVLHNDGTTMASFEVGQELAGSRGKDIVLSVKIFNDVNNSVQVDTKTKSILYTNMAFVVEQYNTQP